jgi:type I restriction enzyme, S subunit
MTLQSINRYDTYKDSGVEWLGEVPAHWVITRNKDIFEERGSLSVSGDETLLTVSHITGVTRRSEKNVNMFMAETMEGYKHCKEGDLIINTMWAWMGALGTANEAGICSPAYGVYKPKKYIPYNRKYFDYLYRTPNAITEMTRNSKGIVSSRLRLYPKDFFQIQTALPVEIEQAVIANYLDTKTAQIDRKIDLLSQKATRYGKLKQSLINKTVTRGLNKTVPIKDSGVEWIGEVPAHWQVKRVKELFEISRGRVIAQTELLDMGQFPVYSSQTKDDGCLGYINTFDYDGTYITWTTDGVNAGTVFLRKGKFNCTNICGTLKLNRKNCDIAYLLYSLQVSTKHNKRIDTNGAKIMSNEMMFIKICVPPFAEQTAIANYLDEKTAHIDRIVAIINTQIDKLKELRKALINDVVTGKIRVA